MRQYIDHINYEKGGNAGAPPRDQWIFAATRLHQQSLHPRPSLGALIFGVPLSFGVVSKSKFLLPFPMFILTFASSEGRTDGERPP